MEEDTGMVMLVHRTVCCQIHAVCAWMSMSRGPADAPSAARKAERPASLNLAPQTLFKMLLDREKQRMFHHPALP